MAVGSSKLREALALDDYRPPVFFSSVEEMQRASGSHAYAHSMRRAWESLGLSGILCIDRRPVVYIKEVTGVNSKTIRDHQRQIWNHGTASLLLLLTPGEIFVLSSLAYPASPDEDPRAAGRLVEVLDLTSQTLEARDLIRRIESGQIYCDHPDSFVADKHVDNYLLQNLSAVRDCLIADNESWTYNDVHTLLGRIIFTCYLLDRRVIGGRHLSNAGAEGATRLQDVFQIPNTTRIQRILDNLFADLQESFNGSLFGARNEDDKPTLSGNQVENLRRFLNGEELRSGQQTFGFWVYDFSVIPIETISTMYEDFLAAEGQADQRTSGAYYTRRHLAELVIETAIESISDLGDKRCLDPACGSGIFLVILFNRMAEAWRQKHPKARNVTRAAALIEILKENICGVDVRETACRITCFSLYLALLDQLKPRDIHELQEKHQTVLPDILALARNDFAAADSPAIVEGNFFDARLPLLNDFDLIVGNPPWVSRGSHDEGAEAWCNSGENPYLSDASTKPADRRAQFMPEKQTAHAFLWKAPLHLATGGTLCLLIPSKALLNNRTNTFQASWFKRHAVDTVVQLADFSFVLFEHAACPSTIIRVRNMPRSDNRPIEFLAPKVDRRDPRRDVISVSEEDKKLISSDSIVRNAERMNAPSFWKQHLWGTPRDLELLARLSLMPKLGSKAGGRSEGKRWLKGQGVQPVSPSTTSPKPIWWAVDRKFVDTRNRAIDLVITEQECERVGTRFESLHRERDHDLFEPPLVLVSQGFDRIAYCGFPVVFLHSLQSIAGPKRDTSLLRFLAAYIGSKLARYFLFHTAANWGTERDKVHLTELMNLPFPLPSETDEPARSNEIVKEVSGIVASLEKSLKNSTFGRGQRVGESYDAINPLLYRYFEISEDEQVLIEDTNSTYEPSSTPASKISDIPTLRPTSRQERKAYAKRLCGTLDSWASRGEWRVKANSEISERSGLIVFTLTKTKNPASYNEVKTSDNLATALLRVRKSLTQTRAGLTHLLGLKVFDGPCIHMLKLNRYRDWTQSAALNDADEIAAAILSSGKAAG